MKNYTVTTPKTNHNLNKSSEIGHSQVTDVLQSDNLYDDENAFKSFLRSIVTLKKTPFCESLEAKLKL